MFFCVSLQVYGESVDDYKEAQKMGNFAAWQKQLIWNPASILDYFLDGSVLSESVVPLSGQWEVYSRNPNAALWGMDADNIRWDEKRPWIYTGSEERPLVLFGEKVGASPLFCGLTYRFGVHTDRHVLKESDFANQRHLRIKVYDLEEPNQAKQPVYEEDIRIPLNKFQEGNEPLKTAFETQWDEEYINKAGSIVRVGSPILCDRYGLENWMQYTESRSAFGWEDGSGIILSHRGNNSRYGYVVQLMNASEGVFDPLYSMDFSAAPPASASLIQQLLFMREPRPAGYWGVTDINNEQIRQFGTQPLFMQDPWHAKYWKKYLNLDFYDNELVGKFKADIKPEENDLERIHTIYKKTSTNTPLSYAALDQFARERKDALILAAYVQNEIELVDGVGIQEKNKRSEDSIISSGKISRSPLTTFLEGQGSPWEQCDLLVYLLRQAGYAAAYMESEEPLIFSKSDFTRLLRLQLERSIMGLHSDDDAFVRVRYPWVAYYDEGRKTWVHLFPWIKETKVTEGYDLYTLMPEGYKSASAWVRHYLENDPRILKHIKDDENDTAAILFKRFVEEVAQEQGISPEAIGVHYQNQKKTFSRFEDFPKPLCFEGEARLSDSIANRNELYATVQFEVASVQNPEKKITTEAMRLYDVYNRALYIYFKPVSGNPGETQHEMILRMEGIDGFSNNVAGSFGKEHLAGVQEKKVVLSSDDRKVKIHITYDQKMEGSFLWPQLKAANKHEISYTVAKGVLTGICINIGRITKEMLDLHAAHFSQMDKANGSNNDVLGQLVYLTGMSFFEKASAGDKILADLHKINNATTYKVGLSKLSPDLAVRSSNRNAKGELVGQPVLRFPQVDMMRVGLKEFANGGIRPDLGEESTSVMKDYYILRTTDGSSNEHQVLNDFYDDKYAVSTVKLLQLAHKRHAASGKPGSGFLVFTRASVTEAKLNPKHAAERYFSHITGLDLAKILQEEQDQWDIVCKSLQWDGWDSENTKIDTNNDSYYSIIYMTPGAIYSDDGDPNDPNNQPSYKGMGTLILTPSAGRALISSNGTFMNGGYGRRLSDKTFDPSNIPNLYLSPDFELRGLDPSKPNQNGNAFDYTNGMPSEAFMPQYKEMQQMWDGKQNDYTFFENPDLNNPAFFVQSPDTTQKPDFVNQDGKTYETIVDKGALAPEAQAEHKSFGKNIADPVDIVTGAFQIQAEDLSVPGPFSLKLKRNYSSGNPFASELGYGWKRNLVPYLVLSPAEGEMIQAAESDGTVVMYRKKSENSWEALPEDNEHLTNSGEENSDNNLFHSTIHKETKNGSDDYYVCGADGSVRWYHERAFPIAGIERNRPYLYSWTDPQGNSISFEYGENKDLYDYGQVKRIVTANGNFIGLKYDEHEQLVEAYAKDGRSIHYTYDVFSDLESVTLPDNTTINYTYEHAIADEKGKKTVYSTHRLTREEKPSGRILQNIYDAEGRVIEQKTTRTPGKPVTNVKFAYGTKGNLITSREVRDAFGNLTYYKLFGSLIAQITDPLGHTVYQSWYLGKDKYWDAEKESIQRVPTGLFGLPNHLMKRVDKRGLSIIYNYNEKGNLAQKLVEGADLSGDGKLQQSINNFTYTDVEQLSSVTDNNDKGTYFVYGNSQYPRLVTRIEQRVGATATFVKEYSYSSAGVAKGLLISEASYDPVNSNNRIEILYDYDDRGLPIRRTHKMGNNKDIVVNLEYDLQHNLSREIMDSGTYTRYTHDNMDRLTGVIKHDAKGKELSATYYHYNANGELEWIKSPAHIRDYTLFDYDAAGNRVFKARWRFGIDNPGSMAMASAPIPGYQSFESQAIELQQYDDLGRLIRSFDPEGHVAEYCYDALGRVVRHTTSEKLGGKILSDENYEYEAGGFVAKIIHADKSITKRFYTTNGLLKCEELPNGTSHAWIYDAQGRVISETTENGAQWTTTYDDLNHTSTQKETQTSIVEIRKLDVYGNVIELKDGEGHSINYSYDNLKRLISEERNGEITKYNYEYDETGNTIIEKILSSTGSRIRQTSNVAGKPIETAWYEVGSTKPTQRIHYIYEPNGRVSVIGGNDETKKFYVEDPDGRHLIDWDFFDDAQNPGHNWIITHPYRYDRNNNLLSYGFSSFSDYFYYDGFGHVVKKVRAMVATDPYIFDYDIMERLVKRRMPAGLSWNKNYISPTESSERSTWGKRVLQGWNYKEEHKKEGDPNVTSTNTVTDLNNNTFIYRKDVLGRLADVSINGLDGFREDTNYQYDKAGHILEVKQQNSNANTSVERSYDAAGHVLNETIFLNGQKIADWKQDWVADRRVSLSTSAATWNFSYNAPGKLSTMHFSGPKNMEWSYEYSEAGLLKKRQTPWYPMSLTHDLGGHITSQNVGEVLSQKLLWRRDMEKLAASIFTRDGNFMKEIIYDYNAQNRLAKEFVVPEEYEPEIENANYTFDWDNQGGLGILTGINLRTGYQHAVAKSETEGYVRPETETFNGVTADRLLTSELPGADKQNQFENEEEVLNTIYDSMGRVRERTFKESNKKQILQWDPHGRLLSVILKDNSSQLLSEWKAFYDGFGRRIQTKFISYKNGNPEENRTITLTSLYDPEVEFLELGIIVQIGNNQPRTIWKIYGANNNGVYGESNGHSGLEAIVEADANIAYGIVNSIQGDIVATIDSGSNKLRWKKEAPSSYGPIKIPSAATIEAAQKPGELAKAIIESSTWKGKRVDPTGFINFGARHYDPLTGRFLSCDPLGHEATPDLYAYADGDPVNNIDPDGRLANDILNAAEPTISRVGEALGDEKAATIAGQTFLGCEAGAAVIGGLLATPAGAVPAAICSTPACIAAAGAAWASNIYFREGSESDSQATKVTTKLKQTSLNQMRQQVDRGKAPKEVERFDKGNHEQGEQHHVHLKDGRAINIDRTFKHGSGEVPKQIEKWLKDNGY